MNTIPHIELRPLASSDAKNLFHLWSDAEAVKFTNWPYLLTLQECEERLFRVLEYYGKDPLNFGPFTIHLADGEFAGIVGGDHRDASLKQYEIWYFLRRNQWRKGIAKKAVTDLLTLMKDSGRVRQVYATAVTTNPASWMLLERLNFKLEETISSGHQKHGLTLDLFKYSHSLQ